MQQTRTPPSAGRRCVRLNGQVTAEGQSFAAWLHGQQDIHKKQRCWTVLILAWHVDQAHVMSECLCKNGL